MRCDSSDLAARLYKEIYRFDAYGLNNIPADLPTGVMDIGANVGYFTLRCRALFPRAKIIAYEPHEPTFDMLRENTAEFPDIILSGRALGDGLEVKLREGRDSGENRYDSFTTPNKHIVPSSLLSQMLPYRSLDSMILKVDCEGAERYIPFDTACHKRLAEVYHIAMEVHYESSTIHRQGWYDFFQSILGRSHMIRFTEPKHMKAATVIATRLK